MRFGLLGLVLLILVISLFMQNVVIGGIGGLLLIVLVIALLMGWL